MEFSCDVPDLLGLADAGILLPAVRDAPQQRVPSGKDSARRRAGTCSFGTAKKEMLALADWLRCLQGPAVGAGGGYRDACGPIARLRLVRNHLGAPPAQLGQSWPTDRTNVA